MRTLLAAILCIAGFSQLSCKVNDYCLECLRGDGGNGDGGNGDAGDGGMGMDGSGSGSGCIQTNGGVEICDGKDNDCNGLVDDGTLPEVGDACANQVGECMGGVKTCATKFHCSITTTTVCTGAADTTSCPGSETCVPEGIDTDHIACTKNPTPERCDGKDNDCNGATDEGDPGGGSKCGTDQGECVAGTNHCVNGSVQCQGFIDHTMDPEICDAKDNDCDGNFDEGLTNMGSCGTSSTAPCMLGTLQCIGGAPQCVGAVDPTFEACDGIDNNCNGQIDEGYDKVSDPNTCGSTCAVCTVPASFNANPTCNNGTCAYACKPGYQDKDGNTANGCEFGPCFPSGTEVCDGIDNDCDGNIDETLGTPPAICLTKGECAGTVAQCNGVNGWSCTYPSTVEVDSNGQVVAQESRCDNKDNDCDGAIDEGDPLKKNNVACHDNKLGICQSSGHYICDPNNVDADPICDNSSPGQTASPEACDNVDNDCDGNVDEDLTGTGVAGIEYVNIGGGHSMAKYEMSKPDATTGDSGNVTLHACSKAGVQPWVDITYTQAQAACATVGARLCTEQEWHRACSVLDPRTYPISLPASGNIQTVVEAEDYSSIGFAKDTVASPNVTHSWVEDYTPGFKGMSDMQATPDTTEHGACSNNAAVCFVNGTCGSGNTCNGVVAGSDIAAAKALTDAPHLDYLFTMQKASSTYRVFVLMYSPNPFSNRVSVTVDGAAITASNEITTASDQSWQWLQSGTTFTLAAGQHTVSVYAERDGVRIDAISVQDIAGTPTSPNDPAGNKWAYQNTPNTYQPTVCNGQDYSFSTTLATESRATNVVTVTTSGTHLFSVGSLVKIASVTDPSFNGTFQVLAVPSATTFTYAQTGAAGTSTGGTATDIGDSTIATGSLTSCFAKDESLTGGTATDHAFDMSGNVKEWVQAHQPGQNPIRGGAANNTGPGLACGLNFTLADDTFFFTNVGFRCCK